MKQPLILFLSFFILQIHCMDVDSMHVVNLIKESKCQDLSLLLSQGYDPNTKHEGLTLLHHALKNSDVGPLQVLFADKRLDPNIASDNGKSPLSYAVLHTLPAVKFFLQDSRVDINAQDNTEGPTALHYAATLPDTQMLQLLLGDERINPDICTFGIAPYHVACKHKNYSAFILLSPRTSFWVKHRDKIVIVGLIFTAGIFGRYVL